MFYGNRQVRTRLLGGVGAGGKIPRLPDLKSSILRSEFTETLVAERVLPVQSFPIFSLKDVAIIPGAKFWVTLTGFYCYRPDCLVDLDNVILPGNIFWTIFPLCPK